MQTTYVGIDIAKSTFDVFLSEQSHSGLINDETGWHKLLTILPVNAHCVLEYTGVYSLGLATFLHDNHTALSVINPLTAKDFAAMQLSRAKTDKADARLLASYGQTQKPDI